jgi:PAS domain S-box-containing protein
VSRLFEALGGAADGAFVIDEDLRIVYWNNAAESILGFETNEVTGLYCYQLLHGYDQGWQLICKKRCRVMELAMQSKPVPNYDLHVITKHGHVRWLNMSVFTYRMNGTNGKRMIVHLFHHLDQKTVDGKFLSQLIEVVKHYQEFPDEQAGENTQHLDALTPREREILTHLARGLRTREIAELLSISPNTVRNHIQHILQNLQVHSRLEAVTFAIKHDLIDGQFL